MRTKVVIDDSIIFLDAVEVVEYDSFSDFEKIAFYMENKHYTFKQAETEEREISFYSSNSTCYPKTFQELFELIQEEG